MTSFAEPKSDVVQANFGAADNLSLRANSGADRPLHTCMQCGATKTPQWREGPLGPRTLCNACGVKRHRQLKAALNRQGGTEDEASVSKYKRSASAQAGQSRARALPGVERGDCTQEASVGVKRTPDSLEQQDDAQRLVELACARVLATGRQESEQRDTAGEKRLKVDYEQSGSGSQAPAAQLPSNAATQAHPRALAREELSVSPRQRLSGGNTVHDGVEKRAWRPGWLGLDAASTLATSASLSHLCPPTTLQSSGRLPFAHPAHPGPSALPNMNGYNHRQTSAESAATTHMGGQAPERDYGQFGRANEGCADVRDRTQPFGSSHGAELALAMTAAQRPPASSPVSGPSSCGGGQGLDRSKHSHIDTVLARCSSVLESFPDAESGGLRSILAAYYEAVNKTAQHTRLLEQCLQQLAVVGAQHEQARSQQAAVENKLIEIDALISRLLEGHVSVGSSTA